MSKRKKQISYSKIVDQRRKTAPFLYVGKERNTPRLTLRCSHCKELVYSDYQIVDGRIICNFCYGRTKELPKGYLKDTFAPKRGAIGLQYGMGDEICSNPKCKCKTYGNAVLINHRKYCNSCADKIRKLIKLRDNLWLLQRELRSTNPIRTPWLRN